MKEAGISKLAAKTALDHVMSSLEIAQSNATDRPFLEGYIRRLEDVVSRCKLMIEADSATERGGRHGHGHIF